MTSSLLHFRIISIFLNTNITYPHYILFIFVVVLTALAYDYEIFAFDGANINKFQNKLNEKISHNNESILRDYSNSNIINLTNNNQDSIYGQIAAFDNNVYVVWQESVTETLPEHNYDIFFIKSEDKGRSFSNSTNLSYNIEYSERPQITVFINGDIFIVWADKVKDNNNKQIMFTKSEDNGTTFSKIINLSNNSKNSDNPEISSFNENVYVIWQESDQDNTNSNNNNKNIVFKSSLDKGNTFNNSLDLIKNTKDAFPKINSYGKYVYVVWNNENKNNSGLFLLKSSNKGNNFEKIIKISDHSKSGESQIAVDKN